MTPTTFSYSFLIKFLVQQELVNQRVRIANPPTVALCTPGHALGFRLRQWLQRDHAKVLTEVEPWRDGRAR